MNPDWKIFLESRSAQFDDNNQTHFNGNAGLPDCALFDLSHLGLIKIEGKDAKEFMQGQFTNDAREITPEKSQLSGYCTPKGRMLALFRIVEHENVYLLQLPFMLQDDVQKRLQMFVLRSKVVISNESDNLACIGLAGGCAEELIKEVIDAAPDKTDKVVHGSGISCIRMGGKIPRFQLIIPAAQATQLWQRLANKATPTDTAMWKLLAVRAGEPTVYPETVEAFVPQMTNMQLVNGLSFKKGCYTGQEVVARMQYLGKLKRRMYRAMVDSVSPPLPGNELFASDSTSGQGAGHIVEAALSPDGGYEVLAVVEISSHDNNDVHLDSIDGPQLQFQALPYAFDQEE